MHVHLKSYVFFLLVICSCSSIQEEQSDDIALLSDDKGIRLLVDQKDFIVNGMNWDYYPIGTNYEYNVWDEPEEKIQLILDEEMSLLQNMGCNAIRVYTGIPSKWIEYIHENYGIYTMLNHSFGRYGLTLDSQWVANIEYDDPRVKKLLLAEVNELAASYKDTKGLLFYLLGNENNYGLFWEGAETENIPVEDRKSTLRARAMYRLFNEAVISIKKIDSSHPIAICNGDLQFLDIIKEECKAIDIFGTNMYRGISFGDAFDRVEKELGKAFLFTEFGADAYHSIKEHEDQISQASYFKGNWKEIYENVAGKGKTGNAIGGFTFQFSDGWWKFGQNHSLDIHDSNASWGNGGYIEDYKEGQNNMNEEWFGVCKKGATEPDGTYTSIPRAAYFVLRDIHQLPITAKGINAKSIKTHFEQIDIKKAYEKSIISK